MFSILIVIAVLMVECSILFFAGGVARAIPSQVSANQLPVLTSKIQEHVSDVRSNNRFAQLSFQDIQTVNTSVSFIKEQQQLKQNLDIQMMFQDLDSAVKLVSTAYSEPPINWVKKYYSFIEEITNLYNLDLTIQRETVSSERKWEYLSLRIQKFLRQTKADTTYKVNS